MQEELTNFELQEGGTPIAVDLGTVSYGSPYHKGYLWMGPANNVPLVDGAGQTIWAKGNLLTFTAAESRLVVEQPKYQADASVTRGYRLSTAGFAEQSKITVISGATKRLGVAFSTACDVALGSGTTPATPVLALPTVSAMTYWTKVSMFSGQAKWQALLTCGNKRYSMSISGPANQRIYLAKAPNTPMPSERNTIYYEVQGSTAFFETEFRAIN